MGIIIVIIVGAILGWLASIVVRTGASQDAALNMVVGVSGALIPALLFAGPDIVTRLTAATLLLAVVGALVLLSTVCIFRHHPA
ncbi:GlsB/YeaQ/YmgE family stress response membrane protein [uncultured Croceicoccus sp.]|uniref:GlsB/YeaQ/YmgE family stress response membrane protein n=1 Tax=uncultured Croceicoccus sp. TaxID=1295329 RepID=UPI00261A2B0D|nr:GlsB/YeaQ/YmgE family stress response membrane protein [uncultured Croceicoccus sp.]